MKKSILPIGLIILTALMLISCSENHDRVILNNAISNGDTNAILSLAARGVDLSKPDKTGPRNTPLIWAVFENNKDIISLLLKLGADPNVPNRDGNTALMRSVIHGDESAGIVVMLIKAGANVNAIDKMGCSILTYAKADPQATKLVEILKQAGAK